MDDPQPGKVEISEADRFKQKFPGQGAPKNSLFLKKRLQGGTKYFDSGDYYSAKSAGGKKDPNLMIGKAIPTADQLPQRKQSSSKLSSLVDGNASPQKNDEKNELMESDEQKSKLQNVE